MNGNKIKHVGVVDSITADCMRVRIEQTSACSGCKIASHCSASEQKEKLIEVYDRSSIRGRQVGDTVVLVTSMSTGLRAVVLGFVVPFIILIVALLVSLKLISNEGVAALISLAALVPYYLFLYCVRHRMRGQFSFVAENPIQN